MRNRKLLLLIPVLLILTCLIYLVLPAGPDGPTGSANAREDRTPTCSVENQPVVTDSTTITVNAGDKIQNTIDQARPGDTVVISPGTYNEGVVVKRNNIALIGQMVNNGYDAHPAAIKFGFPAVDIIWDGSGANNVFDEPGASSFPLMLPDSSWSPLVANAYVRVLGVLRRFL